MSGIIKPVLQGFVGVMVVIAIVTRVQPLRKIYTA